MNWLFSLGFFLYVVAGIICIISILSKSSSEKTKKFHSNIAFAIAILAGFIIILNSILFY